MTWTHFIALIPIKDTLAREFYAEMSRIEGWNVRTLRSRIDSMLFERTALSRKPAELAERELKALREDGTLSPDLVFRDPYVLDFLGLTDAYSEKDLEAAIPSPSCSNSVRDSRSSSGRSASPWTATITTSISSSITAGCGVSS